MLITTEQLIIKHLDKDRRCSGVCLEILRKTVVIAGLLDEN